MVEGKCVIDYNYCKGCGICAEECPVDAIEMKMEVE
jgi:pyruvate ferredoxin oxidoreductase delta subunit